MLTTLPISDRNLIITGYRGPNQPFVGRQIAERLRMPYVNTEQQFEERTGLSMEDFRARYGETRLKTIEVEIMEEAVLRRSTVMRISGRTLLHGSYLPRLLETSVVVCLVAQLDAVLQRLHLTLGARYHNPAERAQAIGLLRDEWAVRHLEGVHEIDTTALSEEQLVEQVIALWRQHAPVRG
jgi:shikimate kinase